MEVSSADTNTTIITTTSTSTIPLTPTFPTSSPNGARKRSFHEFEKTTPTPTTDGAGLLTSPVDRLGDENKENNNNGPVNAERGVVSAAAAVGSSSLETLPDVKSPTSVHLPTGAVEVRILSQNMGSGSELNVQDPIRSTSGMTDGEKQQQQAFETCTGPAMKKRKLSPGAKEAKQREKEERERQKLEDKTKKEEEKRLKEEEKKKRDAEREEERKRREEKRKQKEEERAAKEEERRKREDEKTRKERSQMRLNAFFVTPKPAASASAAPSTTVTAAGSPKKPVEQTGTASDVVSCGRGVGGPSDYEREFPDFFLQSHTTMAPMHRFQRDSDALEHVREKVDACMQSPASEPLEFRPSEIFQMISYRRRLGRPTPSVKDILGRMQEWEGPDAENGAENRPGTDPRDSLRRLRMKTLKFGEDVRPPYQGTWTRPVPRKVAIKLSRNPFHRDLPDTNYDYDSEAEWEEPEEGEDLDSDEEEEGSDDGDDDLDGFLDDADDGVTDGKRRLIVGDLEPVCSGICWRENGVPPELQAYKIETISDSVTLPIDPFSTAYWYTPEPVVVTKHFTGPAPSGRSTLHAYAVNTSAQMSAGQTAAGARPSDIPAAGTAAAAASQAAGGAGGKARRPFPAELLAEFKQAVDGSDLTKTGLVEILKKRFPKVSKDVLKETLNQVAVRVGQREVDKKWVCRA